MRMMEEKRTIDKRDISISLSIALLFFLIPFLIYKTQISQGQYIVSRDGKNLVTHLIYLGESIRSGDFPLWTPYLAGGRFFAEDVSLNILYPMYWLISLLPPLLIIPVIFGVHYAIGGGGFYFFLRKISCKRITAIVFSIIYIFSQIAITS